MDIEKLEILKNKLRLSRIAGCHILTVSGQKAAMADLTDYIIALEEALAEHDKEFYQFMMDDTAAIKKEIDAESGPGKFLIRLAESLKEVLSHVEGRTETDRRAAEDSGYEEASERYKKQEAAAQEVRKAQEKAQKRTYTDFFYGRDAAGRLRRYPAQ